MRRDYIFPEILLKLLDEKNISKMKLAKMLNTSTTTIYHWLNEDGIPSGWTLITLSEIFGVSVDYLLFGNNAYYRSIR